MHEAAHHAIRHSRWTRRMALEQQSGLPRGMMPLNAPNADTMVARVLVLSSLDGVTLGHLTHMLTITVKDWIRRKA